MRMWDERRVHPHRHLGACLGLSPVAGASDVCALCDGKQLHDVPELVGERDVDSAQSDDPLPMYFFDREVTSEGKSGEDRDFRRGVESLDISGRISFCESETLSFCESL